ncbi:ZIP zinc transporter-domain-containing protein [Crassisporium funariophilum]|nr:ZIP zinc transporter-domain-containing protein [Crassisporium funariophilum]
MPIIIQNVAVSVAHSIEEAVGTSLRVPDAAVEFRVGVMFIILFVSFFAVSFPTISKAVPMLRIPGIVFFIGKHFGTGVILATAFLHLLDDAFRSLQDPVVSARYGKVGKWTGLIILGSLLAIFLVEYISTSYVNHLQDKPSAPPTPANSLPPSRPGSPKAPSIHTPSLRSSSRSRKRSPSPRSQALVLPTSDPNVTATISPNPMTVPMSETTPLLMLPSHPPPGPSPSSISSKAHVPERSITMPLRPSTTSHPPLPHAHSHHHAHPHLHHAHHTYSPIIPLAAVAGLPIEVLTNSPRIFRLGLHHGHGFEHDRDRHHHGHHACHRRPSPSEEGEGRGRHHHHSHHGDGHDLPPRIGRRRQVVGILVLQLGIMIHSLVIGLTLSVTYGSDFTSLVTAIIFHQLFEGLSLGIRIAALPPKKHKHTPSLSPPLSRVISPIADHGRGVGGGKKALTAGGLQAVNASLAERTGTEVGEDNDNASTSASESSRTLAGLETSPSGVKMERHSVSMIREVREESPLLGGTSAPSSRLPPAALSRSSHHQPSPRHNASSPTHPSVWSLARYTRLLSNLLNVRNWNWNWRRWKKDTHWHWLKPTLSLLFAITTPFGMGVGMAVWKGRSGSHDRMFLSFFLSIPHTHSIPTLSSTALALTLPRPLHLHVY